MDRFIELIGQLPVGTSINTTRDGDFCLDVPKTDRYDRDVLFGEDPITLLEEALEGRE